MIITEPHQYTKGCDCKFCDGMTEETLFGMQEMTSPQGTIFRLKKDGEEEQK